MRISICYLFPRLQYYYHLAGETKQSHLPSYKSMVIFVASLRRAWPGALFRVLFAIRQLDNGTPVPLFLYRNRSSGFLAQ